MDKNKASLLAII